MGSSAEHQISLKSKVDELQRVVRRNWRLEKNEERVCDVCTSVLFTQVLRLLFFLFLRVDFLHPTEKKKEEKAKTDFLFTFLIKKKAMEQLNLHLRLRQKKSVNKSNVQMKCSRMQKKKDTVYVTKTNVFFFFLTCNASN